MKIVCCKILRLDVKSYNIKARYTVSNYKYANTSHKKEKVLILKYISQQEGSFNLKRHNNPKSLCIYYSNSKYMKQKLTKLKKEIDESIIRVGDFITPI